MWQRFSEHARRVIYNAQSEAQRFGEGYVSTEHLLLGVVGEPEGNGARVLLAMGVSLNRVRAEVERQLPRGDTAVRSDMTLTPRAKRVIDLAYDESRELNNDYIGSEHILLGLVREGDGLAGRVLAKVGVEIKRARSATEGVQASQPARPAPSATAFSRPQNPLVIPAALTFARHLSADLLALMLLADPAEGLVGAIEPLGKSPRELASALEQSLFNAASIETEGLPTAGEILEEATGSVAVFGRIAKHDRCRTHHVLLAMDISDEAIRAVFPD